jgi:hypothetical protein
VDNMPVTPHELEDLRVYLAARQAEWKSLFGFLADRAEPPEPGESTVFLDLESARLHEVCEALHSFLTERAGQDSFAKRRFT